MKKFILMMIGLLCLGIGSAFGFTGVKRNSYTKDGYKFRLYQIDKTQSPNSYEYYVEITSNNSKELFTFCFDDLQSAMITFQTLSETAVEVNQYGIRKVDSRREWREYSFSTEVENNGYVHYWIANKILTTDGWSY